MTFVEESIHLSQRYSTVYLFWELRLFFVFSSRNLTSQGDLDTILGREVLENLRSTVLSKYDLHEDHIKDLSRQRRQQL